MAVHLAVDDTIYFSYFWVFKRMSCVGRTAVKLDFNFYMLFLVMGFICLVNEMKWNLFSSYILNKVLGSPDYLWHPKALISVHENEEKCFTREE